MASERIIQLAKNLSDLSPKAKLLAFTGNGYASEKLDGVWVAAVCVNGEVTFYSSTLEKYISLNGTQAERDIQGELALSTHASLIQGKGGEGVCYRPENAGWKSGDRSTNLIRIKEKITYDLEVLGVSGVEAGSNGGLKGVLQVKWREFGKVDGKESIQDIRGMKHDQLREWHENPELIVGKIVEVEAMKFTAYGMLREPRFKGIRTDKGVADL